MASIATATDPDIVKNDVISEAVAQKQRRQTFSGFSATTENIVADLEDDSAILTCQRSSDPGDRGHSLLISDATRCFIENMTDMQVQQARQSLTGVRRKRRLSRIKLGVGPDVREILGDVGRRSTSRKFRYDDVGGKHFKLTGKLFAEDDSDDNSIDLEDVNSVCSCSNEDGDEDNSEKLFCKSLGALAFSSDGTYGSEKHGGHESRPIRRVGVTEDVADKVPEMEKPSARHFFRDLNRRSAVVSGKWKPLSSDWRNQKKQDAAPRTVPEEVGGVGPWWKKVASSFGSQVSLSQQPLKRAKKIDGAAYFRRGKRKADKCDFLQAAALYNLALVEQREELGENHLDCGATLNEIGVCWMMMGEHYPAKTAFEEALYIRQLCLGAGAPELAETTNNIWMLLHEQRAEMEDFLDEKGDEEE